MKRTSAAVAAGLAAIAIGGCGDGRLDSGELHDKVEAACAKASKSLELVPEPTDDRTAKLFVARASRATTILYRELAGLKPPKDAQEGYSFAVGLVRDQARAFSQAESKLAAGGDSVLVIRKLANTSLEISAKEKTSWQIVGVESCASR